MKRNTKKFYKVKSRRRDRHAANQNLKTGHPTGRIHPFLSSFRKTTEY